MKDNIIDAIHEYVNPTTTSNVLYELMVDWYKSATAVHKTRKDRLRRQWCEKTIGQFIGKDPVQTRALLEQHFKIGEYK